MSTALYVILAILIFGLLIFIHEGGHFLTARMFNITVNEFAIGMGPKLLSKKSKKTGISYSLRLLPFGGFVSMAGEDEESDDPNAFNKKPVWQRLIVVAAGALTNLIIGALVMSMLVVARPVLGSTVVVDFEENAASHAAGLQVNDKIVAVDGKRVHISDELVYEIMRLGVDPVDLTVERSGETVTIENVQFGTITSEGVNFGNTDFYVYREAATAGNIARHAFYKSTYTVKMIWESLYDLATGRYGVSAVSGPVKVTQTLTDAAKTGAYNFIYLAVVISMNLGVMNLLPLPALDGGRLVFLIIECIRRKPIRREIEGYINFAGLMVLMLLMVAVCVKDVISII